MNAILSPYFYILFWPLYATVPAQRTEKALIFETKTREIYGTTLPPSIPEPPFSNWAIACPTASDDVLETIVATKSLENKSLFITNTYAQPVIQEETFDNRLCKKPVQISAAYCTDDKRIHLGYEVYYDTNKFKEFRFKRNWSYWPLRYLHIPEKWEPRETFNHSTLTRELINKTDLVTRGFMWISRMTMQYNVDNLFPAITEYTLLRNFDTTLRQCDNYDLGKDFFTDIDINSPYNEENQKKIIRNVDPSTFTSTGCESEGKCISKWQLIPANQLSLDSTQPRTCSNLTTIPIWTHLTRPVLHNLDRFLHAFVREMNENLDIVINTAQSLSFSSDQQQSISSTSRPIFLHETSEKIPIPDVLAYLLTYTLYAYEKVKISKYAIIVVVHNNPNFDYADEICPHKNDTCIQLGWNRLQYEITDSGGVRQFSNLYCCEPTETTLQHIFYPGRKGKLLTLNLRRFPVFARGVIKRIDITQRVEGNMDQTPIVDRP